MQYNEIEGDLIELALQKKFNVIAHGCNCFCTMGAGIAPQMAKAFGADEFPLELEEIDGEPTYNRGDVNKLGQIDYKSFKFGKTKIYETYPRSSDITIVNCYTQYGFSRMYKDGYEKPLDYNALVLCLKKMNHIFKGLHIGLPQIGCGLAGGDWAVVKLMIQEYLTDCQVTVVIYKPKENENRSTDREMAVPQITSGTQVSAE